MVVAMASHSNCFDDAGRPGADNAWQPGGALSLGDAAHARRCARAGSLLDRWATPLWMGLHWLFIVRSAFGRVMVWRGIRYRVDAPQRVEQKVERVGWSVGEE